MNFYVALAIIFHLGREFHFGRKQTRWSNSFNLLCFQHDVCGHNRDAFTDKTDIIILKRWAGENGIK